MSIQIRDAGIAVRECMIEPSQIDGDEAKLLQVFLNIIRTLSNQ
jgi:hypothetical protein